MPVTLPAPVTTDKSGQPETSTPPPFILTVHQLMRKGVKCGTNVFRFLVCEQFKGNGESRRPPSSIIAVTIEQQSENR